MLRVTPIGDRGILLTRRFSAPRPKVLDAMTRPEILRLWFYGPPGWRLDVCEVDLRKRGAYRYVWRGPGPDGEETSMGVSGVFRDLELPRVIAQTERFDEPWYPGQAVGTLVLEETADGGTSLSLSLLYESAEARDIALQSPMERGVAMNYDRLEALLAPEPQP